MRAALRRLGDRCVGLIPPSLLRTFLKAFTAHPEFAERAGFSVMPSVFWSPVPNVAEIDRARFDQRRALPAIDLRLDSALALLDSLLRFAPETARFPRQRDAGCPLWLENGTYADFDATTLYAMLRHLRPRRYIEVGCGFSTRASTLALARNADEGAACTSHFIEPYPSDLFLELKLPGTYHRQKIQDVPLDLFRQLEAGDVLFIDTSHVLKVQGDVEHELLRVLPSLAPGVWVHVHDIFTPYEYPVEWFTALPRGGNNEQYALECLLSGGGAWQVELPVHLLWREYRDRLAPLCPSAVDRPAAFWMTKTR